MTDQEMRERMQKIDLERERLKEERETYETYFREKREDEEYERRKSYEGKYYEVSGTWKNNNVKYFKILNVSEENIENAECLCIFDGYGFCGCEERGIKTTTLSLWYYNDNKLLHHGDEPLMIDVCTEISQEQFLTMYEEITDEIAEEISVS